MAPENQIVKKTLVTLLIVLSLLGILAFVGRFMADRSSNGAIKAKKYQALFLTNGQVYFGHLGSVTGQYVQIKDIFYLQVQQQVQPTSNSSSTQQPQVSLAKLGSELHGPEDTMFVAKSQVLFWENLKDDGKVVQAIKDYQSKNK